MRFALALSVALNLLLLTSIVAARIDPELSDLAAAEAAARALESRSIPTAARDAGRAADLLGILEGTTLSTDELKPLVLGWLQRRYRSAYESAPSRYWEKGYSPGRDQLAAEYAAGSAVRAALVELFGPAAATDPAFDVAFRPLGPAYAFLGSRAQLSFQERELKLLADPPRRLGEAASGALLCRAEDARTARAEPLAPQPGAVLTEAEDIEYRLRFSPLAAQLRDAGIARDEAEFRGLFELVRPLEQRMAPSGQADLRARLRERMGDERFDRFWSMRDPLFAAISEQLTAQGLTEHQATAAYSIINRSQEALLSLIGSRGDPASIVAASRRVREDETSALSRLLGAESAGRIQAAMSEISLRLSQGSASAC